jgi:hypothetical protein
MLAIATLIVVFIIIVVIFVIFLFRKSRAVCFLSAQYCPNYVDELDRLIGECKDRGLYDFYLCIDKPFHAVKSPKYVQLLAIDEKECVKNGYYGSVLYFINDKNRACSRDKALYHFCMRAKTYESVWFLEDDVAFADLSTIVDLDRRYDGQDIDLLVREHQLFHTPDDLKTNWHWPTVVGKIAMPYATSMICVIRASGKLLDCVREFAEAAGYLVLDELMFNTLAFHNGLNVASPPEFERVTCGDPLPPFPLRRGHFYHPVKQLSDRQKCVYA